MQHKASVNPKLSQVESDCVVCKSRRNHVVVTAASVNGGDEDGFWWENYMIVQCGGCARVSYRTDTSSSEDVDYNEIEGCMVPVVYTKLFPVSSKHPPEHRRAESLPDGVLQAYRETLGAIGHELPILAMVGIRAVVEMVCNHLQLNGKNLEKKIDELVSNGHVPTKHGPHLHAVRGFGNDAAHQAKPPSPTELETLLEIAESLLFNVFLIPEPPKR